jgi:hypothetical protein
MSNIAFERENVSKIIHDSAGLVIIFQSAGVRAWSRIPELLIERAYRVEEFYQDFCGQDSQLRVEAIKAAQYILSMAMEYFDSAKIELGKFVDEHHVDRIAFNEAGDRWYEKGSIYPTTGRILVA